ncbi:MAG: hypothetical protein HYS98_04800 [Deltaproteobacteria bacterium]|nr:hypothetical protein [Deltaproteobacteria bacterium]
MKRNILFLAIVSILLMGCGEEAPEAVVSTPAGTTITQLTLSLSPAPVTGTLILAQTTERRPGGGGTIPVLKAVNEVEFDTNHVSRGYIFVGRVSSSPVTGAYQLRSFYLQGIRHYALFSPFAPQPSNSELVGYGYQNQINNSVALLCEFPFGFAMCSLFPNQRGQPISYIFYTTDEDVKLGRNQ